MMQGPSAYGIIAASQVIIGPAGGWFVYDGDPMFGNPPVAYSAPTGVTKDPFGNILPINGAVVSLLSSTEWSALSQGAVFFFNSPNEAQIAMTSAGVLQVQGVASAVPASMLQVVSIDGNTYSTQHLFLDSGLLPQTSTTSPQTVTNLSFNVIGNTPYHIRGHVRFIENGNTGTPEFQFSGPSLSSMSIVNYFNQEGTNPTASVTPAAITALATPVAGGTMALNAVQDWYFEGTMQFTATGLVSLQFLQSGASTFSIDQHATMVVEL